MTKKYTLLISEKPDAMRRIAKALAEKKSLKKRISEDNVDYYEFERHGKKHVIVCAVGHLFILNPANKGGWTYPIFDYKWVPTYEASKKSAFSKKYFDVIKEVSNDASNYIVCCDFDTEGSTIAANILRFICGANDGKRMKFSTLVKDELVESYENAMPHLDFNQIETGLTRHELDWIYGINLTRALTLAMKSKTERGFQVISTGRVQGPTLAMFLEKELKIRKFKSKPFWQLELHCKVDSEILVASYEKDKIWKKEEAEGIVKACKNKNAKVNDITRKKYKQKPPFPFNTTDLQTESYNQFGFSPRQTINIAESLYQMGAISYPRSSSQKLPPNINYKKIIQGLSGLKQYKNLCEKLLGKKKLVPNEGPRKDPAHPSVYATQEVPDVKKLTAQQKKIYDLVVRRTMATFADVATKESMKVVLVVNKNNFVVIGRRTIDPGWIEFYGKYARAKEQILPELKVEQKLKVLKLDMLEKETQPPGRFTQGSIMKELEKRNLGTRATRADILQTLYNRGYIQGKSIEVTKFGEVVIKVLKEFSPTILSEKLTRKFEKEMEKVYEGKKKRKKVVKEAEKILKEVLKDFKKNEGKIGKKLLKGYIEAKRSAKILGMCPNCKTGELKIIVSRRTGKRFVGCSSYPKCKTGFPLPLSGMITPLNKLCETCGLPVIQVWRKGKRPFRMCINHKCKTKADWGKKKKPKSKKPK